jgi:hypothetical protein
MAPCQWCFSLVTGRSPACPVRRRWSATRPPRGQRRSPHTLAREPPLVAHPPGPGTPPGRTSSRACPPGGACLGGHRRGRAPRPRVRPPVFGPTPGVWLFGRNAPNLQQSLLERGCARAAQRTGCHGHPPEAGASSPEASTCACRALACWDAARPYQKPRGLSALTNAVLHWRWAEAGKRAVRAACPGWGHAQGCAAQPGGALGVTRGVLFTSHSNNSEGRGHTQRRGRQAAGGAGAGAPGARQ